MEMSPLAIFDDLERRTRVLSTRSEVQLRGASEQEVLAVERYAGHPLPEAYREFLLRMGGDGNRVFMGSDYTAEEIVQPDIREHAEYLLRKSDAPDALTSSSFVFMMHQGYVFYWFDLNAGDDPPVFCYNEKERLPKLSERKFTVFLTTWLVFTEEVWAKRPIK